MTRGEQAKTALVAQAERLFAQRGIEAVSLRDVSAAAGQRNHSAAQYHFGDRQGLVRAVYLARLPEVDRRRQRLVDAMAPGDVTAAVAAVVVPLVEVVAETQGWYGRFLARTRWDPFSWDVIVSLPVGVAFTQAITSIDVAFADLPPRFRRQRIDQFLTLVLGTIGGWEGAPDRGEPRLRPAELADDLVQTSLALLRAPIRTQVTT